MGIPVNAKISDYGISQYITPQGFCEIGGTPGYRAPEVVRGDSMYNKEVRHNVLTRCFDNIKTVSLLS